MSIGVLFIAVDDLRPELGCYGVKEIKTPKIDSLAAGGLTFDRAYCQLAVCNPSRVSLMTGLRPDSSKVWDLVTRFRETVPDVVTLPQQFKKHGYYAVSYGKVFHNPWPDNASWSEPHRWPERSSLWSEEAKQRHATYKKKMRAEGRPDNAIRRIRAQATEIVDVPDNEHIDGAIAEQALAAMQRLAKQERPFFLAAGFIRPHLPFVVPRKYTDPKPRRPQVIFYNRGEVPLTLFWVTPDGKEQKKGVIQPGRQIPHVSTLGHRFLVRGPGGFSKTFEVKKQRQTFEIESKPATTSTGEECRPNIVFLMADDWSWPHAGILGDPVVKTPHFDRIARQGVLFENAFVSTPSCTPSRLSILTGQHHWRLKEGDSLGGSLREEFDVYTEMLQKAGYRIGRFGKGVWPSKHTFRNRDSFGERFGSFDEFIKGRGPGEPFCYWHGGQDPHRPYELNVCAKSGIKLSEVKVPACLPDNETVRSDVADYLWEVQRFDREVGEIIARLQAMGELDNTMIVVSGDNGMPFPRCKATLYDQGTRVPLAIRWGARVQGHRQVADFVSLCDLAPTFLEAAGLKPPEQMTGRSLMPVLTSKKSGQIDAERTFVLTGMEQHVYSYPSRALRTRDFLYIRNFDAAKWPTGEVEGHNPLYDFATEPWPTESGAFSFNIDPSPSKQFLRLHRNDKDTKRFANLAFLRHPEEELYDLRTDPDQLLNVAGDADYAEAKQRLRQKLDAELIKSDDARLAIKGRQS